MLTLTGFLRYKIGMADIVEVPSRMTDCYYANPIEGHNTALRDIERALSNQFEAADERRNLQLEACAHIRVQREVDWHFQEGALPEPASVEFILWLHRSFYEGAPDAMLLIDGKARMTGLRERTARDLLGALTTDGILRSATSKGAVSLRFPLHAAEVLFPGLFPEA